MMTRRPLSRRSVLRGAAGASIALPLLDAMGPDRRARAADVASMPKRLLVVAVGNGTFPERFWPTPPGGKTFPASYTADEAYHSGDTFLDTNQHTLSPILEPLAAHKDRMLVLEGIDNCSGKGGHSWFASLLTSYDPPAGPDGGAGEGSRAQSFDQWLADNIGKQTRFPSLQFGVLNGDQGINYGTLSWYGPNRRASAENDPAKMFARLFGGAKPTMPSPGVDPMAALRAQRKSVLDAAIAQMTSLRARLGSLDRAKLDNHLDSLRAIEMQMENTSTTTAPTTACGAPTLEAMAAGQDEDAKMPAIAKAQIDQMVMAVACDLSRVMTLQIGQEGCNLTHPFLGIKQPHHTEIGHGDDKDLENLARMVKIGTWHASQVAYLLDQLATIKEGEGTALDNTLVLWVNGLSKGNSHCNGNIPTVLAGNVAKQLRSGRYVRFARDPKKSNYPFNVGKTFGDLCITLARAMGLSLTTFGDPRYMNGGMSAELLV